MNITKFWKRTLVGGAAALTLAAGLLMTTGVDTTYAQADPDTPDTSAWEGRRGGPGGMRGGHFGGFGGDRADERQNRLAESLGISVEELEAAQEEAHAAAVAEAVANGDITQEQADLMDAHKAVQDYINPQRVMAQALGVSVEELEAAHEDGTLRELLSGLELDRAEIGEKMKAAMDDALNQAVADDVITQEQADQLQEQGGARGFGNKGFGKRGFDGRGFGHSDDEGRGERAPGGFFNQSNG